MEAVRKEVEYMWHERIKEPPRGKREQEEWEQEESESEQLMKNCLKMPQ